MALVMHVAESTAPKSMPVVERTAGWTKMMYDIVMNVVSPARISVRIVVRDAVRRKVLSRSAVINHQSVFIFQSVQNRIPDLTRAKRPADIASCVPVGHAGNDSVLDTARGVVQAEMFQHHCRG